MKFLTHLLLEKQDFYYNQIQVLQELWESCVLFRSTMNATISHPHHNLTLMTYYFFFTLSLFIKGRDLFDTSRTEYPLHKAVFENNLPLISRLVNCVHDGIFHVNKNQIDLCGNTPLTLAVKLGYVDAVKVLSDLFTCPKLKPLPDLACAMDIASTIKNKDILKILLETNQKIKQHYLDLHKDAIFKALESLPDFKIDILFNCKSNFIPFVRNITPNDTYKIYKQGSQIRLDMTLVGFRKLKCIRGHLSVLFKGRGQENEGELFVVDHDAKSVQNIFSDIAQAKIDKDLDDILNEVQQYQKLYKADKFKINAELDKKGEIIEKVIEGYKAEKYSVKTTFTMTKFKINMQEVNVLQKYKTFEEYLVNQSVEFVNMMMNCGINECSNVNVSSAGSGNNRESSKEHKDNANNSKESYTGFSWNIFSSSTQQMNDIRVDTDQDHHHGGITSGTQVLTQTNMYRDHTNINNTIMGYTTNKKTTKKTINANIWLSKNHPLSLDSFFPLLHVLSFSSKQIAKFKDYLDKYQLPPNSFPLKAKVPLFLTMKAAFALQNLSFDTSDFPQNLFTIDEEYLKIRAKNNQGNQISHTLLQMMNPLQLNPTKATHTLNQIYKLCKTDEDYEEDDDDSESLERANELFNSMLKKQVNQSEELLLDLSSFHSEQYDSVDLSEKHINDESFKLGTHAFAKVQTMNQINVRHEGDDDLVKQQKQMTEYQKQQLLAYKNLNNRRHKMSRGGLNINKAAISQQNKSLQQQNKIDNLDKLQVIQPQQPQPIQKEDKQSLILQKQQSQKSTNKLQTSSSNTSIQKRPFQRLQKGILNNQQQRDLIQNNPNINTQQQQLDQVETLKKNFQPRSMKNYKNMIKYESNQAQLMEGVVDGGVQQQQKQDNNVNNNEQNNNMSAQTPQMSTADTSVITTNKINSMFAQQNQLSKQQQLQHHQNMWYKQIMNGNNKNKSNSQQNNIEGGGYLQTIESEEVMGTEGPETFSQAVNGVHLNAEQVQHDVIDILNAPNSAVVTQSNFEDGLSRKSFLQSFSQLNHQNNMNSSRESSLKSFNSGGNTIINKASFQQEQQRHTHGNYQIQGQNLLNNPINGVNKTVLSNTASKTNNSNNNQNNINKEERKILMNHNTLIASIHNYVNQHNLQDIQQKISNNGTTPQKQNQQQFKFYNKDTTQTPQQNTQQITGRMSTNLKPIDDFTSMQFQPLISVSNSANTVKHQLTKGILIANQQQINKSLLPPKVSHKRQSSYGGSGSANNVSSYINNVTNNDEQSKQQQQQLTNNEENKEQQNNNNNSGLFNMIFGNSFSRTNTNQLGGKLQAKSNQIEKNNKNSNTPLPFNIDQQQSTNINQKQNNFSNVIFSTFDGSGGNKNRPISNTHYVQSPPLQFNKESGIMVIGANGINNGSTIGMNSTHNLNNSIKQNTQVNQQNNNNYKIKSLFPQNVTKKTNDVDIFLPYQF